MFMQILGCLLYFIMDIELLNVFYFSKKVNCSHKNLCSLLWDISKKMNPESSGLSYVRINLQKLKICQFK